MNISLNPGCGDFNVQNIYALPDPCPLPTSEKKRTLNEKERMIYAPMSGVGGIVYDKVSNFIVTLHDIPKLDYYLNSCRVYKELIYV